MGAGRRRRKSGPPVPGTGRPAGGWRARRGRIKLCRSKPRGPVSDMAISSELSEQEVLAIEAEVLRREHRDLDEAIHALEARGPSDVLTVKRLKKQKLVLKDRIARIEDRLLPDIIA